MSYSLKQTSPRIHSYVMEHDLGFAPNPFHGVCTLACGKPSIRKYAQIGALIMATGSKPHNVEGHLVYWMRIDEIITFQDYYFDPRFQRKHPNLQGSLMSRYGDNIYHRHPMSGIWEQDDSFHSLEAGVHNVRNIVRDTLKTDRVLIGRDFCYWGGEARHRLPERLKSFVHTDKGHKNGFSETEKAAFLSWLDTLKERGWVGDPADWIAG